MVAAGQRAVLTDEEMMEILQHHVDGRTHPSSGCINRTIDPYSRQPERLPNFNRDGSCYYANLQPRNRRTHDGSGYWKAKDRRPILRDGRTAVGIKRNFDFYSGPNYSNLTLTKWIMTEYTLSSDPLKALCVIRMKARNQGNEIRVAIPNPLPPEPDDEDTYDRSYGEFPRVIGMTAENQGNEINQASTSNATNQQLSNSPNFQDILKGIVAELDVEFEASPQEFNDMDRPTF